MNGRFLRPSVRIPLRSFTVVSLFTVILSYLLFKPKEVPTFLTLTNPFAKYPNVEDVTFLRSHYEAFLYKDKH